MPQVFPRLLVVAVVAQSLPVLSVILVEVLAAIGQRDYVIKLRCRSCSSLCFALNAQGMQAEVPRSDALQLPASDAVVCHERSKPHLLLAGNLLELLGIIDFGNLAMRDAGKSVRLQSVSPPALCK